MDIACFGDSNTYGFDPRSYFGSRYPEERRWVNLLAAKTGWIVRNWGENGREIPCTSIEIPSYIDSLLVMLGTNDLLQGVGASIAAKRMEHFLRQLPLKRESIILIGPPPIKLGAWVPDQILVDSSRQLLSEYQNLAEHMGIHYVPTHDWNIPLCFDGVHFTEEGHRIFSEKLYFVLS